MPAPSSSGDAVAAVGAPNIESFFLVESAMPGRGLEEVGVLGNPLANLPMLPARLDAASGEDFGFFVIFLFVPFAGLDSGSSSELGSSELPPEPSSSTSSLASFRSSLDGLKSSSPSLSSLSSTITRLFLFLGDLGWALFSLLPGLTSSSLNSSSLGRSGTSKRSSLSWLLRVFTFSASSTPFLQDSSFSPSLLLTSFSHLLTQSALIQDLLCSPRNCT